MGNQNVINDKIVAVTDGMQMMWCNAEGIRFNRRMNFTSG